MKKIVFYQHHRVDGGTRTGVVINDTTEIEQFVPGRRPPDPVVLWSLDLRCRGARLPTDPEDVLRWLVELGPTVRTQLTELAEKVESTADPDAWPLLWDAAPAPRGLRMQWFCHAIRPMTLPKLAAALRDVRDRWEEILAPLSEVRAAST